MGTDEIIIIIMSGGASVRYMGDIFGGWTHENGLLFSVSVPRCKITESAYDSFSASIQAVKEPFRDTRYNVDALNKLWCVGFSVTSCTMEVMT